GQRRLAHPGQVLDQDVALGDHADQEEVQQVAPDLDRVGHRERALASQGQRAGDLLLGDRASLFLDGFRAHAGVLSSLRSSPTTSRIARATSAFDPRGTWRSPFAVTMVTSFSGPSNPMSARAMSLTTTASRPLRASLSRPYSRARSPCSAAKPISSWPGR